ncbi:MAG: aminoacyl-tRNA hydrolase [Geminicoccaceae bacterium]
MKLLVGLGNPGDRYARHRHNVGFMALDAVADACRLPAWKRKFQGRLTDGLVGGDRAFLLEPQTYMNESGRAVAEAARFHRFAPEDIIVFHDELDLAPGKVRVKLGGGVAGHNGLRSIAACIGTKDFRRVRIGIGHPGHKSKVTGHVLGDFSKSDRDWLDPLLDAMVTATPLLVAGDDAGFMNKVALLTQPRPEKRDGAGQDRREGQATPSSGAGRPQKS